MKNQQKVEAFTLGFPVNLEFFDLDTVEQVVEEAFIKEPKKRRKKA
jgi:hypothetical protein